MATPLYDALVTLVRDWSNKPKVTTLPVTVLKSCINYGTDDTYKHLRVPALEVTMRYTVESAVNDSEDDENVSIIPIPSDLVEFIMVRTVGADNPQNNVVFNEVTDKRTFFDGNAEFYSRYRYMWSESNIYISPKLAEGAEVDIHYYRRLPALTALYDVDAINYVVGNATHASQPYMTVGGSDETLWFVAIGGIYVAAFDTEAEADAYIVLNPTGTKSSAVFDGNEAANWLRDTNEQLCIWGGLKHVGAYLEDLDMEKRYEKKWSDEIERLNREEKFRRAKGGNVQINVNGGGLI
jgi:hypothetical protein